MNAKKTKIKIVLKKKTISNTLKLFLKKQLFNSIPTKAELRKMINTYIADNNLQALSGNRQHITLNKELRSIAGTINKTMTIYELYSEIFKNSNVVALQK
jgi:hypothetical protein